MSITFQVDVACLVLSEDDDLQVEAPGSSVLRLQAEGRASHIGNVDLANLQRLARSRRQLETRRL